MAGFYTEVEPKFVTSPGKWLLTILSELSLLSYTDERRLRKLKVFLKSVSYNGCEGANLPNLNDLYADQLLVDEFPCQELSKNEEFKCNPTPFVIASCFNRNQVKENSNNNGKGNKAARRTPRKQNSTPRRRNPQNNDSSKTTKQNSPRQPCEPSTLQQLKSPLSAEKTNPVRRLFADKQSDKSEHVTPRKEENLTKQYVPVKLDEKTVREK